MSKRPLAKSKKPGRQDGLVRVIKIVASHFCADRVAVEFPNYHVSWNARARTWTVCRPESLNASSRVAEHPTVGEPEFDSDFAHVERRSILNTQPDTAVMTVFFSKAVELTDLQHSELDDFAALIAEGWRYRKSVELAERAAQRERRSKRLLSEKARELWRRQTVFAQTEQMAKVGGWEVDLRTYAISWSDEIYRISEMSVGEKVTIGRALSFYPRGERAALKVAFQRMAAEHTPFDLELPYRTARGNARWIRTIGQVELINGEPARVFGTVQDITERKLQDARILYETEHDVLTGLYNRKFFAAQLDKSLGEARRHGTTVALILVDLDSFKLINDTFGHESGDAVLRLQAERLRGAVRSDGIVARLGGDEFAVLLQGVVDQEHTKAIGDRILAALREPVAWDGRTLDCKGSLGIAIFPQTEARSQELFKSADLALYKAKAEGRNRVAVYAPALRLERERRSEIIACARRALNDDRILPYYQPVIELGSGRVSGFEALLRWIHPTQGIQLPGLLAPAFDDPEIGCAIGARMRKLVMADMAAWSFDGVPFGRVGVNVSEPEFESGELAARIISDLDRFALPTSALVLEVTENALLSRSADPARKALQQLRDAGMHIALDDFGTGASSLVHLQQFPVSAIKIDRSFVMGITSDRRSAAIVSAMIALSRELDFDLIAEGVETIEQLSILEKMHCARGQGFLFGKAMPAQQVRRYMHQWPEVQDHPPQSGRIISRSDTERVALGNVASLQERRQISLREAGPSDANMLRHYAKSVRSPDP